MCVEQTLVLTPKARTAELTLTEVAALRIYTTVAFKSINDPLRDVKRRERRERHPLFLTVVLIKQAVLKLRAVEAVDEDANREMELYRGMKNVGVAETFLKEGGTEVALMSTTADIKLALKYSASNKGLLFRLKTKSAMERGADLSFLSCFPGEKEYLFPPLTYLQPVMPRAPVDSPWVAPPAPVLKKVTLAGANFLVLEVEPKQ